MNTNIFYRQYLVTYTLIFLCAIPVLINVVFGCLAYRNIRQSRVLTEEHADRQLTRMTLIQILLIIISVIPPGIYSA